MSLCSAASCFLPSLGPTSTASASRHRFRRDSARLLMGGALICFNYAYVDLTNSFIQITRVLPPKTALLTSKSGCSFSACFHFLDYFGNHEARFIGRLKSWRNIDRFGHFLRGRSYLCSRCIVSHCRGYLRSMVYCAL